MSTDSKIEDMIFIARTQREAHFKWGVNEALSKCESPIEQLFAASIFSMNWNIGHAIDEYRSIVEPLGATFSGAQWWQDVVLLSYHENELPTVCVQQPVCVDGKSYRLDFVFVGTGGRAVAIELDGHDFHERTKEQAARDKSRDRALTRAGWFVVRFTGSEIYADARACCGEVFAIAHNRKTDR